MPSSSARGVVLASLLSLCLPPITPISQTAAAENQAHSREPPTPSRQDHDAANSRLLGAAEPFEALTEQAFSATTTKLNNMLSKAENAANKVRKFLPEEAQGELSKRLGDLRAALGADNRSEIALSSVEGYRILVSSTHEPKVSAAVGLLDYSGFRYNADLKTRPIRWSDMEKVLEYANGQWSSISNRITDEGLVTRFGAALGEMERAVIEKNVAKAEAAVKLELDLVDRLERYFSHS